jgi:phosphoribosylanthranilate isomerase
MTKVKICGIQDSYMARHACTSGADYLGFVFAPSARQIDPVTAKEIISGLPDGVKTVGVFVDDLSIEKILEIAGFCGLDILQLHGDKWNETAYDLPLPVIQLLSVKENVSLNRIAINKPDYILFDTYHAKLKGGTGIPFDWNTLDQYAGTSPYFIAGGLNPSNVSEVVTRFSPYAVDVSSGVETNGQKDPEKIKRFIKIVKESTHELFNAR